MASGGQETALAFKQHPSNPDQNWLLHLHLLSILLIRQFSRRAAEVGVAHRA